MADCPVLKWVTSWWHTALWHTPKDPPQVECATWLRELFYRSGCNMFADHVMHQSRDINRGLWRQCHTSPGASFCCLLPTSFDVMHPNTASQRWVMIEDLPLFSPSVTWCIWPLGGHWHVSLKSCRHNESCKSFPLSWLTAGNSEKISCCVGFCCSARIWVVTSNFPGARRCIKQSLLGWS